MSLSLRYTNPRGYYVVLLDPELLSKNKAWDLCFKENLGKGVSHSDVPAPRQEGADTPGAAWPLTTGARGIHGSKHPPGRYTWSLKPRHTPSLICALWHWLTSISPGAGWLGCSASAHESRLEGVALSEGYRKWR